MQYYTSAESQLAFAKAGVMPSRESAYTDAFFTGTDQGKEMGEWKAYIRQYGRFESLPKDFTQLSQDLVQAVQEVLLHGTDPEHALAEATQAYNQQREH